MDPVLEPVVAAAQQWAEKRERVLDVDLLVQALDLRLLHDQMGDSYWPAGSVRHLMTERYPVHGPVEQPDVDHLVATLDTWWRFLRTDGRMSAQSAQPSELFSEAKKSRRAMAAAYDDQDTMRRRRAFADHRSRLDEPLLASNPSESAADLRASGLWLDLQRLLAWLGEGRPVDEHGDLLLDELQDAYHQLGLGAWFGAYQQSTSDDPMGAAFGAGAFGSGPVAPVDWDPAWVETADCLPLDRLWWVAVRAGLVRVVAGQALPATDEGATPSTPEQWVELAMAVEYALCEWANIGGDLDPLPTVLMLVNGPTGSPRSVDVLLENWLIRIQQVMGDDTTRAVLAAATETFLACLATADDAGLWRRNKDTLHPTALGWDTSLMLSQAMAEGAFDEISFG